MIVYRRAYGRASEIPVEFRRETHRTAAGTIVPLKSWALRCPTCFGWSRLRRPRHAVTVHKDGAVSVKSAVLCPNAACGWHVTIRHDVALDVNPPQLEESKRKAEIAAAREGRRLSSPCSCPGRKSTPSTTPPVEQLALL
jgi:hypothetical protein